jgi:hypothetical protein
MPLNGSLCLLRRHRLVDAKLGNAESKIGILVWHLWDVVRGDDLNKKRF